MTVVEVSITLVEVVEEGGNVEGGSVDGTGTILTIVGVGTVVVVVLGAVVDVVVVSIIVNNVRNSSSLIGVCLMNVVVVVSIVTGDHFSSIMIAGSLPRVSIAVPIEPRPSPAPNRAEPRATYLSLGTTIHAKELGSTTKEQKCKSTKY